MNNNPYCKCLLSGFCERHNIKKTNREFSLCSGEAGEKGLKYWNAWENGELGATPPKDPKFLDKTGIPSCKSCGTPKQKTIKQTNGPGTELLKIYQKAGVPSCQACKDLAKEMDRWGVDGCEKRIDQIVDDIIPRAKKWIEENKPWVKTLLNITNTEEVLLKNKIKYDVQTAITLAQKNINTVIYSSVKKNITTNSKKEEIGLLPFSNTVQRNLLYHIYPAKGNGIWQWNLDQLLSRIHIFNGRKIIAISVDDGSDSYEEVQRYLAGVVDEFLVFSNDSKKCEMVSFVPLLDILQTDDPNQITFRAHAKGVSQITKKASHIINWTEMLYRTCLDDIKTVESHLQSTAMTGSCRMKRQFKKNRPTYSGSFYWFRNRWVYQRNWKAVNKQRWGCESWPGEIFTTEETNCLFLDNTKSMYSEKYWNNTVNPSYKKWANEKMININYDLPKNNYSLGSLWFTKALERIKTIDEAYSIAQKTPSDIYKHIPLLNFLSKRCDSVYELGVREGVSTVAIYDGCNNLHSVDQNEPKGFFSLKGLLPKWNFIQGDSCSDSSVRECDMLFIDTFHTGKQLRNELNQHSHKVKKWIVLHDTETFGLKGEDGSEGLLAPINELVSLGDWKILQHTPDCNGLTVLERIKC